jgi:hypothetical protein
MEHEDQRPTVDRRRFLQWAGAIPVAREAATARRFQEQYLIDQLEAIAKVEAPYPSTAAA